MTSEKTINAIAGYVATGKLKGVDIVVPFRCVVLKMTNIRFKNGEVIFDQYRKEGDGWVNTCRNNKLWEHVDSYLTSVLAKIKELVSIDKNLF